MDVVVHQRNMVIVVTHTRASGEKKNDDVERVETFRGYALVGQCL